MRRILPLLAALTLALTACSGDDSGSAGDAFVGHDHGAAEVELPECADVWVVGGTVPRSYAGCYDSERDTVNALTSFACGDGTQLVTFREDLWARGDGAIARKRTPVLTDDPGYGNAFRSCNTG